MSQVTGSSTSPAQWWQKRSIWVVRGVDLQLSLWIRTAHKTRRNTEGPWLRAALPRVPPPATLPEKGKEV